MSIEELIRGVRAKYPHSRLEAATAQPLESLAEVFGKTPPEYPSLLRQLGHGVIGRNEFMLYSGPVPAEEILPGEDAVIGVLLIGDDLAGHHVGYKRAGDRWIVVEFDHGSPEEMQTDDSLYDALSRILSIA